MNKYSFRLKHTGNNVSHGAERNYFRMFFDAEQDDDFVQRLIGRILMRPTLSEIRNNLEEYFVFRKVKPAVYEIMLCSPIPPKAKQFNYSEEDDDEE